MTINLDHDLEVALVDAARLVGTDPAKLAIDSLKQRFVVKPADFTRSLRSKEDQEMWVRRLIDSAKDCGIVLTDEQLSREHIYD